MSDIIDGRWTCNSQDSEGLVKPHSGGPAQLSKCPKCNSDAVIHMYDKIEGRFEEYQETVICEECKAIYEIDYSIALKAVKITKINTEA